MANQVENQQTVNAENVASTKEMKRGTIIQAVKAIAVLVCICLICGALLALCNDLFYISDEERFNRSMAKIYPDLDISSVKTVDLNSEFTSNASYGEVKSVVTDGEVYIIEALGKGGYQNGTVTLYVIVGKDAKIISWTVKENVGQSYIDRVPSDAGSKWYVGKDVSNALDLDMTGATVVATSTAICNAVNMAAFYCRSALGVGKDPEADSKKEILALLGDGYASYEFATASILNNNIDATNTVKETFKVGEEEISYIMYADGDNGLVKAYVYGQEAETQKIVVFAGADVKFSANLSETDEFVTAVSALNGKFSVLESGGYTGFGYIISINTTDGTVYSVSGIQFRTDPSTYVLNVTIANEAGKGKVTAITAVKSGYLAGWPSKDQTDKLIESLVGVTLDTIESKYESDKVTNATQSANLIRIAVETALRDYDAKLAAND